MHFLLAERIASSDVVTVADITPLFTSAVSIGTVCPRQGGADNRDRCFREMVLGSNELFPRNSPELKWEGTRERERAPWEKPAALFFVPIDSLSSQGFD